jgi:CHAT domain-containing protein/tetratricopeptide (TPR) repeat protein
VGGYRSLYRLALYAEALGDLETSEKYLLETLRAITACHRTDLIPHIYMHLIKYCRIANNSAKHDIYVQEFHKIYDAIPDSAERGIARVLIEMAYSSHHWKRFAPALLSSLAALSLAPWDLAVLANTFNLIGLIFAHCGDETEAYKYFEASLATRVGGCLRAKALLNKAKCDLNAKRYGAFFESLDEARALSLPQDRWTVAEIDKFRSAIPIEVHAEMTAIKAFEQPVVRVVHKVESWDSARALTADENVPDLTQMLEKAAANLAAGRNVAIRDQSAESQVFDLEASLSLVKNRMGPPRLMWRSVGFWCEVAAIESVESNRFWWTFGKVALFSAIPFLQLAVLDLPRSFGHYNMELGSKRPTEETVEGIEKRIHLIEAILQDLRPQLEVGTNANLRTRLLTAYSRAQNALAVWSTECFKRTGDHRYRDAAWTALRWTRGYQLAEAIGFTDETKSRLSLEADAMGVLESCRQQVVMGRRPEVSEIESEHFLQYLEECRSWRSPLYWRQSESIEVIQSRLARSVLWLIFVIQDDCSFIWRISHNRVEVSPLPASKILANVISRINEYISSPPLTAQYQYSDEMSKMCSQLSRLIFGNDIDLNISRIIVSPDGPSWELPLEALPDPGENGTALGAKYEIVWSIGNDNPYEEFYLRPVAKGSHFALIGDPIYPLQDARFSSELSMDAAGPNLNRLPFSADEIDRIQSALKSFEPRILTGVDATVSNTIECLSKYEVVHIACHAIEHNDDQMLCLSCVTNNDNQPNPAWSRREICQNRFTAKFVTLSACATATGKVRTGEGPYSLGRAFLEAGIPSVLVTSWLISDEATAVFMETFYSAVFGANNAVNLLEGLRQAREAMIREKKWRHPYFWACYRLMVSGVSIKNPEVVPIGIHSKALGANAN